jgi:hypothetical protein
MRDSIQVPLASIEVIRTDAARARAGAEGTRNPGTSIPGVLTAGTFTAGVYRTFWDVHNPDNAISIRLRSSQDLFAGIEDRYDELIVEVANPAQTVERINRALSEIPGDDPTYPRFDMLRLCVDASCHLSPFPCFPPKPLRRVSTPACSGG